ncbi:MAG TPA: FlgO family outer membrane protein [Nitrospiraceae bacterium]|nr:FlgO family outer membrane protein [Nitrospiraceae bacterium]
MRHLLMIIATVLIWTGPAEALSKYEERLNELAEGIISEAVKEKAVRLAILDFTDQKGNVTPLGQFLAEELGTQILVVSELTVVDRTMLSATMAKHRLKRPDPSQSKSVRRVAKALRVDLFVAGSFIEIPEGIQVSAKLIRPRSVQAAGAARSLLPKSGPLAVFFKAPPAPAAPPAEPKMVTPSPAPPSHTNDLYAMVVDGIGQQGGHIAVEMTLENRSSRDIKIHCRLQDTYVKDEHGTEWRQDISKSRDGLCVRGMELAPGRKAHTALSFPIQDQQPASMLSLHFHETSPRHDLVFSIDGLRLEPHRTSPEAPGDTTAPPPQQ